jgi:hypothetical protein
MPTFSASTDAIALTAAVKTILEIATPATTGILIIGWWVEFDGVTAANVPVKVEVGRFSAVTTTMTNTMTPSKMGFGANAIASQCTVKNTATAEGAGTFSDGEIHRIPPTSGIYIQYPLGREWTVPASSFFRIRVTPGAAVNVTYGVQWAE